MRNCCFSSSLQSSSSSAAVHDQSALCITTIADELDGPVVHDHVQQQLTERDVQNKRTFLADVDQFFGHEKPPAVEYIFVETINAEAVCFAFGHAAIRYTLPGTDTSMVVNVTQGKQKAGEHQLVEYYEGAWCSGVMIEPCIHKPLLTRAPSTALVIEPYIQPRPTAFDAYTLNRSLLIRSGGLPSRLVRNGWSGWRACEAHLHGSHSRMGPIECFSPAPLSACYSSNCSFGKGFARVILSRLRFLRPVERAARNACQTPRQLLAMDLTRVVSRRPRRAGPCLSKGVVGRHVREPRAWHAAG